MDINRFREKAAEIALFCKNNGYNERIVLLWDLSVHSGRRRFVVWNLVEGRAERKFVA